MANLIKNITFKSVSGTVGGIIAAGYSINQIILNVIYSAGSVVPTVKIGSTIGGDDILKEYALPAGSSYIVLSKNVFMGLNTSEIYTIYAEISSGILDIYIQTIKANA